MFVFLIFADLSSFFQGLLGVVLFLISFFLVFVILIQRGKGGGIAGSLTGTAHSAFGARGGDTLMWLTLSLTLIWILLCCITIYFYSRVESTQITEGGGVVDPGSQTSPGFDINDPASSIVDPLQNVNPSGTTATDEPPTQDDAQSTDETEEASSGDGDSVEPPDSASQPKSTPSQSDKPLKPDE